MPASGIVLPVVSAHPLTVVAASGGANVVACAIAKESRFCAAAVQECAPSLIPQIVIVAIVCGFYVCSADVNRGKLLSYRRYLAAI